MSFLADHRYSPASGFVSCSTHWHASHELPLLAACPLDFTVGPTVFPRSPGCNSFLWAFDPVSVGLFSWSCTGARLSRRVVPLSHACLRRSVFSTHADLAQFLVFTFGSHACLYPSSRLSPATVFGRVFARITGADSLRSAVQFSLLSCWACSVLTLMPGSYVGFGSLPVLYLGQVRCTCVLTPLF